MARWKLTGKHYLKVPDAEWEYEETTNAGKRHKMRLPVPVFLDPDDPEYLNRDGELIVAHAGPTVQRGDVIFTGPPTSEMEPLDDEARKITEKLQPEWNHPIDSLPITNQSSIPAVVRK